MPRQDKSGKGGPGAGAPSKSGTNENDVLDGSGGSFRLEGFDGDDLYIVDDVGDEVVEKPNRGTDTVAASITYTLPRNVENLTLTGSAAIDGTGNDDANEITGNAGNNRLFGLSGDDILSGGAGDDIIDGGDGIDTAVYGGLSSAYSLTRLADGSWRVVHLASGDTDTLTGIERLAFDDGVFAPDDLLGDGPVANDDTAVMLEDEATLIDVLGNDQGNGLSIVSVSGGALGTTVIASDGKVQYEAAPDAAGTDTLTYEIVDAAGRRSTATIQVQIDEVNDAPVAVADDAATSEGSAVTIDVLANDTDVDGDTLSVESLGTAVHGSVSLDAQGRVIYTPEAGFSGTDSFTYTVGDGRGGSGSGTVTVSVAAGEPDPDPGSDPEEPGSETPPYYVTNLFNDAWRMNAPEPYGTSAVVTFTFLDSTPSYYQNGLNSSVYTDTFAAFNETERQVTRDALAAISDFANIEFVEVSSPELAQVTFGFADLGFAAGTTLSPSGDGTGYSDNDIWLNVDYRSGSFVVGSEEYKTLIHEIGHALGLDHVGPGIGWEENHRSYTVMSYSDPLGLAYEPSTYMLFDIATLQYLYGANTGFRTGNDVYRFGEFDQQLKTIWDGGGYDTVDFSAASYGVEIDLREGGFGSADPYASNTFSVAYGTVLEAAIGGAYGDRLIGNSSDNVLTGGGGADVFVLGSDWGQDRITDFVRGVDVLDLSATGLSWSDLSVSETGGDTVISSGSNRVVLEGVTGLDAGDFLMA